MRARILESDDVCLKPISVMYQLCVLQQLLNFPVSWFSYFKNRHKNKINLVEEAKSTFTHKIAHMFAVVIAVLNIIISLGVRGFLKMCTT